MRRLRHIHPFVELALAAPTDTRAPATQPVLASTLTAREEQIAELIAAGAPDARIAETLGLRETTIRTHLTRI